jgi:hypothetical protein
MARLDHGPTRLPALGPVSANDRGAYRAVLALDARLSSVAKMQAALEKAGVEFIAENCGGVGLRMKKRKRQPFSLTLSASRAV